MLSDDLCVLRRKLIYHASDPWEGDNVTLKHDLTELRASWVNMVQQSSQPMAQFPSAFTPSEEAECLRLYKELQQADAGLQTGLEVVGAGPAGWVPVEHYDEAKGQAQQLLGDTLETAELEEERREYREHWFFNDFDEIEYR